MSGLWAFRQNKRCECGSEKIEMFPEKRGIPSNIMCRHRCLNCGSIWYEAEKEGDKI